MMKKLLTVCLLSTLLTLPFGQVMAAETAESFKDTKNHWADTEIKRLTALGAIGGYEDHTFKPDSTITRAEFAKILCKSLAYTLAEGNSFSDTRQHWAKNDIHTLVEKSILEPSEYGNAYQPDLAITRSEMAVMLVRAYGYETEAANLAGTATGFTDENSIPDYNKGYLLLAKELKLIGGYEDGSFKPAGQATRAEASAMIVRLLDQKMTTDNPMPPMHEITPVPEINAPGLTFQAADITGTTGNSNSLGEQFLTLSFDLKISNNTTAAVQISSQQLKIQSRYQNGNSTTTAPAILSAFSTVVAPGQRLSQPVSLDILLPSSNVAQMTLGDQIIGYTVTYDDSVSGILTLDNLALALEQASK